MAFWYLWSMKKIKVLVCLLWIITVLYLEHSNTFKYPLIVILYLYILKKKNKKENRHPSSWDGTITIHLSQTPLPRRSRSAVLSCFTQKQCWMFWSSQWIVYYNMTAQYALIFFLAYSVRGLGHKWAGVTPDKHSRLTAVEITILN